eukprot:7175260-Prymnesium_polylepis.1
MSPKLASSVAARSERALLRGEASHLRYVPDDDAAGCVAATASTAAAWAYVSGQAARPAKLVVQASWMWAACAGRRALSQDGSGRRSIHCGTWKPSTCTHANGTHTLNGAGTHAPCGATGIAVAWRCTCLVGVARWRSLPDARRNCGLWRSRFSGLSLFRTLAFPDGAPHLKLDGVAGVDGVRADGRLARRELLPAWRSHPQPKKTGRAEGQRPNRCRRGVGGKVAAGRVELGVDVRAERREVRRRRVRRECGAVHRRGDVDDACRRRLGAQRRQEELREEGVAEEVDLHHADEAVVRHARAVRARRVDQR